MEKRLANERELNYRNVGIFFIITSMVTLIGSNLFGIFSIGSNAILGLDNFKCNDCLHSVIINA